MSFSEMMDVFGTIYMDSWWLILIIFFSVVVGMTVSNCNNYKLHGYVPGEWADDMFYTVMLAIPLAALWPIPLAVCSGLGIYRLGKMAVDKLKPTK